ncbi:MAG: hypothetical protein WAT81_01260 [Candidatus Moraniibacteriota bacterium]
MMNLSIRKYVLIIVLTCIVLLASFIFLLYKYFPEQLSNTGIDRLYCASNVQFSSDVGDRKNLIEGDLVLNESGTVHYFKDTFDQYGGRFSTVVQEFDSLDGLSFDGPIISQEISNDKYSGTGSLAFEINSAAFNNVKEESILIKSAVNIEPGTLSIFKSPGVYSAWIKVGDRRGIKSVQLKAVDSNGNIRAYGILNNLQINSPNQYDNDDLFPNVEFPVKTSPSDEWTDFWLASGWNYLFWRTDDGFFIDTGKFDSEKIARTEMVITVSNDKSLSLGTYIIDNLRFQNGFQKESNPLGGVWYPPLGRPQYGVFDVNKVSEGDYELKLQNVRQSQYPSNGDHGRMLLRYGAPINFSMRIRFSLEDLPEDKTHSLNTWFRLFYDFEPDFDPGHDWFGTNMSLEFNKFGIISVKPIERFISQEQEPKNEDINVSSKNFSPQEGVTYEEHVTVRGQLAIASIYEVKGDCLVLKKSVQYTFNRARYGEEKRYPFGIEITGNVKAIIKEFEVVEL